MTYFVVQYSAMFQEYPYEKLCKTLQEAEDFASSIKEEYSYEIIEVKI